MIPASGTTLHIQHYNDVIMSAMVSQITSLTIVYSTVYRGADQRKHRSSASLAFVRGLHQWPLKSPHNVENVSIWWRHHGICMVPFAWVMYVLNRSQQVFKDRYINMCGIWHIWTTVPFDELQAVNQCFWQTTTAPILDKITAVRHTSQRIQHIDVGWK